MPTFLPPYYSALKGFKHVSKMQRYDYVHWYCKLNVFHQHFIIICDNKCLCVLTHPKMFAFYTKLQLRCSIFVSHAKSESPDIILTILIYCEQRLLNQVVMLKSIILILYLFKTDVILIFWYVQNTIITHE